MCIRDRTRDSKNFFVIDDNFHDFLNNAVPNHYIQENFKIINNQNQRIRIITGQRAVQRLEDTRSEHLAIVKACVKKDWKAAAEAMYEPVSYTHLSPASTHPSPRPVPPARPARPDR